MTIIDINQLPDGGDVAADVCIVGGGACGVTLALELASAGRSVCLLESGGFKPDDRTQSLYDTESIGYPLRENFMSRARWFGGSCNLWAGRAMRMSPIDFEKRDWVPDSGWPIAYSDLEPWYRRAEKVLRVPPHADYAEVEQTPGAGDGERAFFASPDLAPTVALWGIKPMRFGKVFRRTIRRHRGVRLYLNANVTEIVAAPGGRSVERLAVRSLAGKRITARAGVFVLAAGGLENTRLLLASRSQCPEGMGNEHDLVGRYYLDHPRSIFGSIRVQESVKLPYITGVPLSDGKVQYGIALSERAQRERRVLNSYVSLEPQMSEFAERQYGRSINVLKVLLRRGHAGGRFRFSAMDMSNVRDMIYFLTPKEIMPHFLYRPYAALKRRARRNRPLGRLTIINFCEQPPDPSSRVRLGTERDELGMPGLLLDWRLGDEVARSVECLHEIIGRRVRDSQIGTFEAGQGAARDLKFTDASHHMGTTRMSTSPRQGVVDADCRVHGLANLYVGGSSVFPTAGHANPTLTIVALALRLADHLKSSAAG